MMKLLQKLLDQEKQEEAPRASTSLIFVFDRLPRINQGEVARTIETIEPLRTKVNIDVGTSSDKGLYAVIEFENHRMKLIGADEPVLPQTMEQTVQVSNWEEEQKAPLLDHKAHIVCWYEGANATATEQIIALYKVAYSFYDTGLLGVLDAEAWNCMPRDIVRSQTDPLLLHTCRDAVPFGIWTGFVELFKDDNRVWYCSKGHHRFGISDFAYLGTVDESSNVYEMFGSLFGYMHDGGADLTVGDTAQLDSDQYLRFGEVQEYKDYLESPLGTLVIEKIDAADVDQ